MIWSAPWVVDTDIISKITMLNKTLINLFFLLAQNIILIVAKSKLGYFIIVSLESFFCNQVINPIFRPSYLRNFFSIHGIELLSSKAFEWEYRFAIYIQIIFFKLAREHLEKKSICMMRFLRRMSLILMFSMSAML